MRKIDRKSLSITDFIIASISEIDQTLKIVKGNKKMNYCKCFRKVLLLRSEIQTKNSIIGIRMRFKSPLLRVLNTVADAFLETEMIHSRQCPC